MTDRPDDPWNRANDPWNRPDDSGNRPDDSWESYPPEDDLPPGEDLASLADPAPQAPEVSGYPDTSSAPPSPPPTPSPTPPHSGVGTQSPPLTTAPAAVRSGRTLRWKLIAVAAAAAVAGGVALLAGKVVPDSTTTLPTVWSLDARTVAPDRSSHYFSDGIDGTAGTAIVATDDRWIALLVGRDTTDGEEPAVLLAITPDSGEVAWTLDLPGAVCSDRTDEDGSLPCLTGTGST